MIAVMELSTWGDWAIFLLSLAAGFGLLYAKVSSISTDLKNLTSRMKEDHEEHVRIWTKLDEHTERIVKLEPK